MDVTVNLDEMAGKLSISLPTMRKLTRLPGFPIIEAGRNGVPWQLNPEAVIAFVRQQREAEDAGRAARSEALAQISLPEDGLRSPEATGVSPTDQLKAAQTRRIRMATDREAAHLVLKTEMRHVLATAWTGLMQAQLALPGFLGRRHNLPHAVILDMRRQIEGNLRATYNALTDLLPGEAQPPDSDVPPPH